MKKTILAVAFALVIGVLGTTVLKPESKVQASPAAETSSPKMFGDACKNVKFKVTNNHSKNGDIEIRGVEYFNKANGKWQTEDLPNVVVGQDRTVTTGGDDLKDSEGEDLTKFKFIYRWKANGREANWSGEVKSKEFVPDNPTCNANRTYGNSSWIIG